MRKIYVYSEDRSKIPIMEFLKNSDSKIRKKFNFMIAYIKDEKNILCEPYSKHFTIERYKMLYELRLKASGTMIRIIYYEAEENIILLHAFYKKDKRDTERALEYSLKLLYRLDNKALYPFENLMEVNFV